VKDREDDTARPEGQRIVLAIREGLGKWEASEGEVVEGVLVMRRAERQRECCGEDLTLVAEASRGSLTWELRRCLRCEREYSNGPVLPACWVTALAGRCIDLYEAYEAEVSKAYGRRSG
jgi:hypothetical protein